MFGTSGEWRERGARGEFEWREARPDGSGEGEWGVGRNEQREASLRGKTADRLTAI
jgi:hypothetical protein